jgi:hypothetical protein
MLMELAPGRRVSPSIGRFQEDLWMTSYESAVFVAGADVGFRAPALRSIPEVA